MWDLYPTRLNYLVRFRYPERDELHSERDFFCCGFPGFSFKSLLFRKKASPAEGKACVDKHDPGEATEKGDCFAGQKSGLARMDRADG